MPSLVRTYTKTGLVKVARVKGPDLGGREIRALRAPMSQHRDTYDATAPP